MKEIIIGTKLEKEMIITKEDLASRWGSGKANVYATPCMIAFMELTSTELVDKFLEEDEITVGIAVNIKHIKASFEGQKVICEAIITEVHSKAVFLDVACYVDGQLIGNGTHKRYVVEKTKFEKQ